MQVVGSPLRVTTPGGTALDMLSHLLEGDSTAVTPRQRRIDSDDNSAHDDGSADGGAGLKLVKLKRNELLNF